MVAISCKFAHAAALTHSRALQAEQTLNAKLTPQDLRAKFVAFYAPARNMARGKLIPKVNKLPRVYYMKSMIKS